MAIPSESSFVASIKKFSECNAAVLWPAFSQELFKEQNSGDALRLIRAALRLRDECWQEMEKDEVVLWLDSQDAYVRAMNKLLPGTTPEESLDDRAQWHLQRFHRIA